ncbi:hypothetical protein P691DRAFT_710860 [Macrolepiota fuliginosa MF-IS2]|uniref:Nephrocystin 3-like N-terminal domain-containing protein n=1 Tax=Macrolepiota fuliginosa MF-IS2 TaxID=1400762 RepID=A0A9P5X5V9_9AGAR|nr:hypothetical protein P691DRAFT_710860 [Macrolepiota fuliginosa MF-IS2]
MIWMHGSAGVGKSAIMRTLAEMVSPHTSCVTLFLSRDSWPPRNDSKKVFTTLAYSLAVVNGDYCGYVLSGTSHFPRELNQQFESFFLVPFTEGHIEPGPKRCVVLLDGLDECKNADDQCRIVGLICDSILHHNGDIPFVWVITSRPEDHLIDTLLEIKEKFLDRPDEFWELKIPVNPDGATRNVERYLRAEFMNIREKHPESFPNSTSIWPSDGDFIRIAKASPGLFVFTSTVTKYVSVDNPTSRLKLIMTLIDRFTCHPVRASQTPFSLLDALYIQIMSEISEEQLSIVEPLLGFFSLMDVVPILRVSSTKVGLVGACNILGLQQDEVYGALSKLHPVLILPSPRTAERDGIQFFHASFPDFLSDHSRSQDYHINPDQELTNIWRSYIRILKESHQTNMMAPKLSHNGVNILWVPGGDDARLDETQKCLLSTAQQGWVSLLIKYGHPSCTSCPCRENERCLMVDASELIDVFRSIHPFLFRGYEFPVEKFIDWLNYHAPRDVREKMVSRRFPVAQLDTERLFKSLHVRPWWQWSHSTGEHVITMTEEERDAPQWSDWSHARGQLWATTGSLKHLFKLLEGRDPEILSWRLRCAVTVVGMEPSELYAVIGPIPELDRLATDYFYYVLPYFGT